MKIIYYLNKFCPVKLVFYYINGFLGDCLKWFELKAG